jgi:hypothetical protein
MRNLQKPEILVFAALAKMDGFQCGAPLYAYQNVVTVSVLAPLSHLLSVLAEQICTAPLEAKAASSIFSFTRYLVA